MPYEEQLLVKGVPIEYMRGIEDATDLILEWLHQVAEGASLQEAIEQAERMACEASTWRTVFFSEFMCAKVELDRPEKKGAPA